jgi:ribose 5-phosphate isomerase RpiB
VLAFGLRLTSIEVANEMVDAFLATAVDADERPNIDRLR